MATLSDRIPPADAEPLGDPACAPGATPTDGARTKGPCDCLPAAQEGWLACAHCGLPQRPGKEFCGFCGRRWLPDESPTVGGRAATDSGPSAPLTSSGGR